MSPQGRNIERTAASTTSMDTSPRLPSLLEEYRGQGLGNRLMRHCRLCCDNGVIDKTSLAVQEVDYALRIYQKSGFSVVDETE